MEEFNEIFDILYDVKEKIPEYQYLKLSNLIKKLYDMAKYSQELQDDESEELYTDIEDDVEYENYQDEEAIYDLEESCGCDSNTICCSSFDDFKNCKNYYLFVEKNPIILNLFEETPIDFTIEPFNSSEELFFPNLRNLVSLYEICSYEQKIIILVALYDLFMKNYNHFLQHQLVTYKLVSKLEHLENNQFFLNLCEKNYFDYNIWKTYLE